MPKEFANEDEYRKWIGEDWQEQFEPLKLEPRRRPRALSCYSETPPVPVTERALRLGLLIVILVAGMFAVVEMLLEHMNR